MTSAAPKGNLKGLILNGILAVLPYITPKKKDQILLGSMRGNNFRGFVSILRSSILITSYSIQDVSFFQYLPGRFNKVQTYHGLPLKGQIPGIERRAPYPLGFYLIKKERLSNRLFVTTSEFTAALEKDFYYKNRMSCGYPRNDIFFDRSRQYFSYRDKFQLSQYSSILLYCPTFRDADSGQVTFHQHDLQKLDEFFRSHNQLLMTSSHHLSVPSISYEHLSNIISIDGEFEDIQDLLVDVDVLISDYSSITLDFILSGKPVIYYPYDYEHYTETRGFCVNYFQDLPGPFPCSPEELYQCLETIDEWSTDEEYIASYTQLVNRFHLNQDGKSSSRLTDLLNTLV